MDQRGLVERAGRGDHDAFAELARAAVVRLDQAARLILRDPELARDAVQEGLIRAWRDLPKLRDPDWLDGWLYRLTVNACIDLARRRRRRPIEVELTAIHAPAVTDTAGLVAYSRNGDIFVMDPDTGTATPIVTGPDIDANPVFSRDGTKVAFLRQWSGPTAFDVVVAGSDGSNPRVVSDNPISLETVVEWSAGSRSLLMTTDTSQVVRVDASGASAPTTVIDSARWLTGELRPPDGRQILYEPDSTPEVDLWIMDADGANAHLLYKPVQQVQSELDQVRWSPDGSMIAFTCAAANAPDGRNICVMRPDGTGVRPVTNEGPKWVETDLVWAPDGTRIAFNRWHDAGGGLVIEPIGVASLDDPTVVGIGPAAASEGALFDWSPDGTTILSLPAGYFHSAGPAQSLSKPLAIDVASGKAQPVSWVVASNVSWQRTAR